MRGSLEKDTFYRAVSIAATFILFIFGITFSIIGYIATEYISNIKTHLERTDRTLSELSHEINNLNNQVVLMLSDSKRTDDSLKAQREAILDLYDRINTNPRNKKSLELERKR